jgi:hypothetical protein
MENDDRLMPVMVVTQTVFDTCTRRRAIVWCEMSRNDSILIFANQIGTTRCYHELISYSIFPALAILCDVSATTVESLELTSIKECY